MGPDMSEFEVEAANSASVDPAPLLLEVVYELDCPNLGSTRNRSSRENGSERIKSMSA